MYIELIIVIVTILLGVLYLIREAYRDIFSPVVLALFMMLFFYAFDFLYMLIDSMENDGFWLSGVFFAYEYDYFLEVSMIIFFSVLFWILGDFIGKGLVSDVSRLRTNSYKGLSQLGIQKKYILLCFFLVLLSGGVLIAQINATVGLSVYLSDMASRSVIFEGFTIQNALLHVALLLGALVSSYIYLVDGRKIFGGALLLVCIGIALTTGGRAIVLMLIIVFVYTSHYFIKPFRFNTKLVLMVSSFALFLPFVALLTRTSSEYYAGSVFANIFNTGQVPQANNLFLLVSENLGAELLGSSFLNDIVGFIPGFVFNVFGFEKNLGGNTDFTIFFWPDRWDKFQSQISIGGIGEMYYNFHIFGVVVICFILSLIYRLLYHSLPVIFRNDNFGLYLVLPLYWSIFQQFRGDYFHTVNKLFLFSVAVIIFCKIFLRNTKV